MQKSLVILLFFSFLSQSFAQSVPSKIEEKINKTYQNENLDSLVNYFFETEKISTISARVGSTNHVYFAGRDYGIKQFSLIPSFSYMHSSGLYAEIGGIAYSKSDPKYELTLASVGYMGTIGSKFVYFGEYSHSFFTNTDADNANPITNSLTIFANYELGVLRPSIAYAYLFGVSDYSQIIMPGISAYFKMARLGFIDKITFSPNLYATLGDSKSYANTIVIVEPAKLGRPPIIQQVLTETNNFGLMAYTLSLPVGLKVKNLRFTFSPNFIKPIKLYATEDVSTSIKFNFSTSLYYSIDFNN